MQLGHNKTEKVVSVGMMVPGTDVVYLADNSVHSGEIREAHATVTCDYRHEPKLQGHYKILSTRDRETLNVDARLVARTKKELLERL